MKLLSTTQFEEIFAVAWATTTVVVNMLVAMNEDELLVSFKSTFSSAQRSKAHDDPDAAVAKTAANPND